MPMLTARSMQLPTHDADGALTMKVAGMPDLSTVRGWDKGLRLSTLEESLASRLRRK
jgi:hypothetical protein